MIFDLDHQLWIRSAPVAGQGCVTIATDHPFFIQVDEERDEGWLRSVKLQEVVKETRLKNGEKCRRGARRETTSDRWAKRVGMNN